MYEIIENDVDVILSKVNLLPLKNKSILITGASGLLGIYFVSCLKRLQKEYNLDIYFWIKSDIEKNFQYFFDFKCNIIQHDITDARFFDSLIKFDYIIHSSGYGQPTKFVKNKISDRYKDYLVDKDILERRNNQVEKKINSSEYLVNNNISNPFENKNNDKIRKDKYGKVDYSQFSDKELKDFNKALSKAPIMAFK